MLVGTIKPSQARNDFSNMLKRDEYTLFFQHQYAVLQKRGHLVTYNIQNCTTLFLHGKDIKGQNIGFGAHIGLLQTEEAIDKLIKEIKESEAFSEINSYALIGGHYGITPPSCRSSITANRIKSSMKKHFALQNPPIHEYYDKIGDLGTPADYPRYLILLAAFVCLYKLGNIYFEEKTATASAIILAYPLAVIFEAILIKVLEKFNTLFSAALNIETGKISVLKNDSYFLSDLDRPSAEKFFDASNHLIDWQYAQLKERSVKAHSQGRAFNVKEHYSLFTFHSPEEVCEFYNNKLSAPPAQEGFKNYYKNISNKKETNSTAFLEHQSKSSLAEGQPSGLKKSNLSCQISTGLRF